MLALQLPILTMDERDIQLERTKKLNNIIIRISIHFSLEEFSAPLSCSPSVGADPYLAFCPGKSKSGRANAPPGAKSDAGYAACAWNRCSMKASTVSIQALAISTLIPGMLCLRKPKMYGCKNMTPTMSFTPKSFRNDPLTVQDMDNNQVFWLSTGLTSSKESLESEAPLSCSRLATMHTAMDPDIPIASGSNSGSGIPIRVPIDSNHPAMMHEDG